MKQTQTESEVPIITLLCLVYVCLVSRADVLSITFQGTLDRNIADDGEILCMLGDC